MEADAPHIIPSIYLANYLNQFEEKIRRYDVQEMRLKKGEYLTKYGVINNTAYFIKSGIIHLSLGHDQGRKSLNLFGPGTVFPIGVEIHEYRVEYEMILQALTDIEVYRMSYPTLKKIVQENGDFAGELLRENCDSEISRGSCSERTVILSDICFSTRSTRHLNHVWQVLQMVSSPSRADLCFGQFRPVPGTQLAGRCVVTKARSRAPALWPRPTGTTE